MIDRCLGEALAAQGFATSDIILAWGDIVGARLAARTRPLRVSWPREAPYASAGRAGDRKTRPGAANGGERSPATLEVRAESAFAIELQHMAPVIIERVNAYYGWRCIGRIVIRQGPLPRPAPAPAAPVIAPEVRAAAQAHAGAIVDDRLRAALAHFGEAVLSQPGAAAPAKD